MMQVNVSSILCVPIALASERTKEGKPGNLFSQSGRYGTPVAASLIQLNVDQEIADVGWTQFPFRSQ